MVLSIPYLMVGVFLQLLPHSDQRSKDVEIVVLRHQLRVLRRQVARPELGNRDRVFLTATSRLLPRKRWASFCLTPQSLLRVGPKTQSSRLRQHGRTHESAHRGGRGVSIERYTGIRAGPHLIGVY